MQLEGIHHISCITGDARGNVDFYVRVLGLRLVKKTVNQDDPGVYHLFYADEDGSPGADLTFFEYPGARKGRAGDGMVHRIVLRVASEATLDYWAQRLEREGVQSERGEGSLLFEDPEGLGLELAVVDRPERMLTARHAEIPAEHAIGGFEAVRAYISDPDRTAQVLTGPMGMEALGDSTWEARGEQRGGRIILDPPLGPGTPGAGTVHHVAWSIGLGEEEAWRSTVLRGGQAATPVIDRFYFHAIYFREPGGVLFELATRGPGFDADEDKATLGEALSLPPAFEALRDRVQERLTPLPDITQWRPKQDAA